MSEEPKPTAPPNLPVNLGKLVLEPWQHALAAGMRHALRVGVPTHDVIGMLLNHLASVVAMVEPPGVRAALVKGLVESFPDMIRQHVDARQMTSGGVFIPQGAQPPGRPNDG